MAASRKTMIALAALADMAQRQGNGAVAISTLTRRVPASISYLEQIFAALRKHGLVTGFRGTGGGYRLVRRADQITVADIVEALDGAGLAEPGRAPTAANDQVWSELSRRIHIFLRGITLADLLDRYGSRGLAA